MKARSAFVAVTMTILASSAWTADSVWTGAESTDWATAGNWGNGHVPASDDADGYDSPTFNKTDATRYTVDFGSTQYTVNYPVLKSGIDAAHTYTFTATGDGGLTSTSEFDIGRDPSSLKGGAVILDGGKYTFPSLWLGWYYGYGYLTLNEGTTLTVNGDIGLGRDPGEDASRAFAYGEININGGTLNHTADEFKVGHSYNSTSLVGGRGVVKQTAGTVNTRYLAIPKDSYCYGRYELSGGTVKSELEIEVGKADFGKGELVISGGYMELGSGYEFHVCGNGHSNTGMVYVTGGALVNKDAWFCVGRSYQSSDDASYAYLEIDGGAVSNIADSCNFTIGTLGTDDCHSEVKVKSGELYTKKILFVGEIHPAKMTVTGGHVYANESVCVQGSDSTLIVKGGVIETDHVYKGTNGKLDIRGGTFKAIADESDYFNNCGDLVVSHNGLAMDTAGFNVTIGNNISGLGGITKKGAGTLTLSGTVSVTGAIVVEEGSLVLNGTKYDVGTVKEAVEKAAVVAATWTNALEDGDQADPANWTCYDADGNVVAGGVPGATTAVTIPYSLAVNPTSDSPYTTYYPGFDEFTGYASVVLGISGTAAPRGIVTVPDVVRTAQVWYDFSDTNTFTLAEGTTDRVDEVANKGVAGSSMDGTAYYNIEPTDSDAKYVQPRVRERPSTGIATRYGRNVLTNPDYETALVAGGSETNSALGFVSKSALNLSGTADRTLVAVSRKGDNLTFYPFGIEEGRWGRDNFSTFTIERWDFGVGFDYSDVSTDANKSYADIRLNPGDDPADWAINMFSVSNCEVYASVYAESCGQVYSATNTITDMKETAEAKIYTGMRYEYATGSHGDLAEVMYFDKGLTAEEEVAVREYLKAKWFTQPAVALDTLPSSVAFSGEDAVYNLGGGDWTFANITGAGTISNANVTVTGTITVTVNDDGTIDPLVIDGSLTLGEGAKLVVKNAKKLSAGTALDAITATGGISGAFASVETEPEGVSLRAKVEANDVKIMSRTGLVIIFK